METKPGQPRSGEAQSWAFPDFPCHPGPRWPFCSVWGGAGLRDTRDTPTLASPSQADPPASLPLALLPLLPTDCGQCPRPRDIPQL